MLSADYLKSSVIVLNGAGILNAYLDLKRTGIKGENNLS